MNPNKFINVINESGRQSYLRTAVYLVQSVRLNHRILRLREKQQAEAMTCRKDERNTSWYLGERNSFRFRP